MNNTPNKENNSGTTERKLFYRNVKFTKLSFEFKNEQLDEDISGSFNESFDLHINWILSATKVDWKGIIISCDFRLISKNMEIKVIIQTKMEFDQKISENEVFNTTYFQVMAANFFFPYLTEIISCNTAKMGITPILIGYEVLNKIIEKTNAQGGFRKPLPPKNSTT